MIIILSQTHTMAPWVRRVFIHILPRLLVMRRPQPTNRVWVAKKINTKTNTSSNTNAPTPLKWPFFWNPYSSSSSYATHRPSTYLFHLHWIQCISHQSKTSCQTKFLFAQVIFNIFRFLSNFAKYLLIFLVYMNTVSSLF